MKERTEEEKAFLMSLGLEVEPPEDLDILDELKQLPDEDEDEEERN